MFGGSAVQFKENISKQSIEQFYCWMLGATFKAIGEKYSLTATTISYRVESVIACVTNNSAGSHVQIQDVPLDVAQYIYDQLVSSLEHPNKVSRKAFSPIEGLWKILQCATENKYYWPIHIGSEETCQTIKDAYDDYVAEEIKHSNIRRAQYAVVNTSATYRMHKKHLEELEWYLESAKRNLTQLEKSNAQEHFITARKKDIENITKEIELRRQYVIHSRQEVKDALAQLG